MVRSPRLWPAIFTHHSLALGREAHCSLVCLVLGELARGGMKVTVHSSLLAHHCFSGGSVWESNPPFDSRRAESPALKAGTVTGPFSPPPELYGEFLKQSHVAVKRGSNVRVGPTHRFAAATFFLASSSNFGFTQTSKYGRLVGSPIFPPASSSRVIPRRTTIGSSVSPSGNSP